MNLNKVSSFNSSWTSAISSLTAAEKAAIEQYYPDGTYSASNSSES
jgi:hypothetical protein